MTDIIAFLSGTLNDNTEKSNILLAQTIAARKDKDAVKKLFLLLTDADRKIKSDCIKVVYETAALQPDLIVPYIPNLTDLLESSINRLVWGSVIALYNVTPKAPEEIYENLGAILLAADKGSVIADYHCVKILAELGKIKEYREDMFTLLIERILKSPENQLPAYAAATLVLTDKSNKDILTETINLRLPGVVHESKRKKLLQTIRKAQMME